MGAIGFGLAEAHAGLHEGQNVSVSGKLNTNEFQGKSSIQMVLLDIIHE